MRHQARLSSAVPHRTAFLPPAFIAMLPPTQDASAEVGSTANTNPARCAASSTRRVTTPAPVCTVATGVATPGSCVGPTGPTCSSFSVLITAAKGVSGTALPVYPVPPPRGMIVSPSSTHARTSPGISSSESGASTTNGISTRQSVASVAWDARANGSKQTLSPRVWRTRARLALRRSDSMVSNERANSMTARCASARSRATSPSRSGSSRSRRRSISASRWFSAATSRPRRFGLSSRSSSRYGLRCTTQMSPRTS